MTQKQKPLPQEPMALTPAPLDSTEKLPETQDLLKRIDSVQAKTYWTCANRFSAAWHSMHPTYPMGECGCVRRYGVKINDDKNLWALPQKCDEKGELLENA